MLPSVKEKNLTGKLLDTPLRVVGIAGDPLGEKALKLLCFLMPEKMAENADTTIIFSKTVFSGKKAEQYRLTLRLGCITVEYEDIRGAVNGVVSLFWLLNRSAVPEGTMTDWADSIYRSVMLDFARGTAPVDEVLNSILLAGLSKLNHIHFHLMDSEGLCFRSAALPKMKAAFGRRYSKADLRRMVEICELFQMEIIPEIELPAHANALSEAYPCVQCRDAGGMEFDSKWTLCPASTEAWKLYRRLLEEVAEIFPCSVIHVGGDELEFANRPELSQLCNWDSCEACRRLRIDKKIADKRGEYYYVVNRIHEIISSMGKRMMMWNDQIDISVDPPIPHDIVIQYWRIAIPENGPVEGCSLEQFVRYGFQVINSDYLQTYLDSDRYLSPEKLKNWTPEAVANALSKSGAKIIGGECCAWEYGNTEAYPFYRYTFPVSLVLFADRLWNHGSADYGADYRRAVSECIFGCGLKEDPFLAIGDIIPPREKGKNCFLPVESIDVEQLNRCKRDMAMQTSKRFWADNRSAWLELLGNIESEINSSKG